MLVTMTGERSEADNTRREKKRTERQRRDAGQQAGGGRWKEQAGARVWRAKQGRAKSAGRPRGAQSRPTVSRWGSLSAARAGACEAAPQHQGHLPPPPDPQAPVRAHPTPLTCDHRVRVEMTALPWGGTCCRGANGRCKRGPTKARLRKPQGAQDVTVTRRRRRGLASGAATRRSSPAEGEEERGFSAPNTRAKSKTVRKDQVVHHRGSHRTCT